MKIAMPLFLIHLHDATFSQPQIDLMNRIRTRFLKQTPLFES